MCLCKAVLKRKGEKANVESVEWELSPREAGAGIRNRGCLTRYCVRDGVARPWTPSINSLGPDRGQLSTVRVPVPHRPAPRCGIVCVRGELSTRSPRYECKTRG